MKKILVIFVCFICVGIAVVFISTDHNRQTVYDDLVYQNLEMLTRREGELRLSCKTEISSVGSGNLTHQTWCTECGPILCRSWSGSSSCSK